MFFKSEVFHRSVFARSSGRNGIRWRKTFKYKTGRNNLGDSGKQSTSTDVDNNISSTSVTKTDFNDQRQQKSNIHQRAWNRFSDNRSPIFSQSIFFFSRLHKTLSHRLHISRANGETHDENRWDILWMFFNRYRQEPYGRPKPAAFEIPNSITPLLDGCAMWNPLKGSPKQAPHGNHRI